MFSQEDVEHPAAKATIAAGLRLGTMLKAERQLFQGCSAAYMQARCLLLAAFILDGAASPVP